MAIQGECPATRTQCAALCWRPAESGAEVLLITSRDTGRWVIPKGWPMRGLDLPQSAAREAWEEAGVKGEIDPASLGQYRYGKVQDRSRPEIEPLPCLVSVFGLKVEDIVPDFPEKGQRDRRWFAPAAAAAEVDEPDLQALLAGFRPPRDAA